MGFKLDGYQHVFCLLVMLHMLHSSTLETATIGLQPEGIQCACAGDRLIYNCSVVGGTATRWRGTALDCPLGITLRHSQFAANQESGICNNGDIIGHSIGVVNDCYTSQLNVTVRESFNNKTVQCAFTSSEGTRAIGESLLRVASATNLYPPPDNVYLANAQPGTLVFNWTPVISNCSTAFLQYNIASDCGVCPTHTSMTTATCSDLQLSTRAVMCQFSVSSHACDLTGNPSSPTAVVLKVPDVPRVEIIPSYSTDSQALQRLFIVTTVNQTEDHFYISGNISGSPSNYTAYGSNLISGSSFNSTASLTSCEETCGYTFELPSSESVESYCPQSTMVNVTISAANKLGEGPRSNPFMIECSNRFVKVLYRENSTGSSISCAFLNQSDTSDKTCCVTYGPCDQKELGSGQSCNRNSPNNIQLEVSNLSSRRYCYTVTASNDTYTVKVEGTFTLGDNRSENSNTAAIIAGVVVPIVFMLLLLGILDMLSLVWVAKNVKKRNKQTSQIKHVEATYTQSSGITKIYPQNPLIPYLIPYTVPTTSKLHRVDGDCDLRDFFTNSTSGSKLFKRGHTCYEFTNEVENILEGKAVLLQDKKNTKKWFRLAPPEEVTAGRLKLYGEGIARSSFGDQYRVFIQSFGSGARHLPNGSMILYMHSEDQVEPDVLPLVPVCSKYFAHKVIDSEGGISAQQFCTQNMLNTTAFNIFLTVEHLPEGMSDQPPRDVILMDKMSRELFTGPYARQILDPKKGDEFQHENEKWKVFVLLEKNKQGLVLNKGSEVLYQDSNYQTEMYTVLDVDVHCVRLSKFIKTKLNCQYEDGKAFYEVTDLENEEETEEDDETEREEDLLYYKKILRPRKNELSCEELELQSLIEYFYAIPGVPSIAVKPKQLRLEHHRIFIQSTSQGSRCLKKGEKILYLKEYIQQTGGSSGDSLNPSTVTIGPSGKLT